MKFVFNLLEIFFLIVTIYNYRVCNHKQKLTVNKYIHCEYEELNNWQPIRISADYSGLKETTTQSKKLAQCLKEEIVPTTVKILKQILKVRRIKAIKVEKSRCGKHKIPENMLKFHYSTDLIIFVVFDLTGEYKKNRIEASALHCYQDSLTKRPVVGFITFRDNLNCESESDRDYLVWLTLHELSHVLLFNNNLYSDFIDRHFNLLGLENVLTNYTNKYNQKINYVVTKNVLEKAKTHFGCTSLKGVPLEYNGSAGNNGAHWSRKAMNTDYMIAVSHGENLISEITLAFFHDSGWYLPDYSTANSFHWGRNAGCNFFSNKCIDSSRIDKLKDKFLISVKTIFKKEYCENINQPVCSVHHKFRGYCGMKVYEKPLRLRDANFPNNKIGGFDKYVNRCPIAVERNFEQKYYGGSCRVGSTNELNSLETICPNCACFVSSLRRTKKENNDIVNSNDELESKGDPFQNAACYEFKCIEEEIFVIIENNQYRCPSMEMLKIQNYFGHIQCPDKNILCSYKYLCKFGCTDIQ